MSLSEIWNGTKCPCLRYDMTLFVLDWDMKWHYLSLIEIWNNTICLWLTCEMTLFVLDWDMKWHYLSLTEIWNDTICPLFSCSLDWLFNVLVSKYDSKRIYFYECGHCHLFSPHNTRSIDRQTVDHVVKFFSIYMWLNSLFIQCTHFEKARKL